MSYLKDQLNIDISQYTSRIKAKASDIWQSAKDKLRQTPIEVPICLAAGFLTLSILSYQAESKRASITPLAFSEIEQIEKDEGREGRPLNASTRFYAGTNDLLMKVFESQNKSQEFFFKNNAFARELDVRLDRHTSVFKPISHYAQSLPDDGKKTLKSLDEFIQVLGEVKPVNDAFRRTWEDEHDDVTHQEMRTREVCESHSNGKDTTTECHTEIYYVTVYDYTNHTYTYFRESGELASRRINELTRKHPTLNLKERLVTTRATNADNEYAIEHSREQELDGKRLSQRELLALANNWANGSTLYSLFTPIHGGHKTLLLNATAWGNAKNSAHNEYYRTYSHSDAGPTEFQIARAALRTGEDLEKNISELIGSIKFVRDRIPELDDKVKQYVGAVLDNKPGNPRKLRNEIMELSRELYAKNYSAGYEVDTFRYAVVALWSLFGAAAGAGVGFGLDKLGNRYDWYATKKRRFKDERDAHINRAYDGWK